MYREIDHRIFYVIAVLMVLPMIVMRDFTPDNELRYMSIADEALRNHCYLTFTHHGAMYADKPPLYLLLLMGCKVLSGGYHTWMTGLLSVVPMLVIMRTMNRWMEAEGCGACRQTAMPMLMTTALVTGSALVMRMDMLFTMFIVLAIRAFYNMYKQGKETKTDKWTFPLWLFLAVFTKGALGLLIPLAAITVFLFAVRQAGRWTEFFSFRTWAILILLTAAWFGVVCEEAGGRYLEEMLVRQTLGRAFNSFHHQRPFWYYAVSFLYCSLPWTPIIIYVAVTALRRRLVNSDLQKLLIITPATTIILLSCISSKLDIYMLPAYPFLICFTAMFMPEVQKTKTAGVIMTCAGLVLCAALPVYAIMTGSQAFIQYRTPMFWITAALLTMTGINTAAAATRARLSLTINLLAAGLACSVFVAGLGIKALNPYISYGTACRQALKQADEKPGKILIDGRINHAKDMDAYLGSRMKIVNIDSISQNAVRNAPAIIVSAGNPKRAVCMKSDLQR